MTVAEGPTFRVGAVINRGFKIAFRNIASFGVLALVFTSPLLLFQLAATQMTSEEDVIIGGIVAFFLQITLAYLLSATVVYGTVQELRGRHATIGDSISRGLSALFPVLGVAFLVTLVTIIGSFLIVPGIIAAVMLWVALPAAVIERPGVVASLKRSAELTKGYRWHVFGLILILVLIEIVIGIPAVFVAGLSAMLGDPGILAAALDYIATAIIALIGTVITAVSYYDLRAAKEGIDIDQIAAVFD